MEPDIKAVAHRVDEIGGTLAAVLAVVASIPGVDAAVMRSAREILDVPLHLENFSVPQAAANRALDRIEEIAARLHWPKG